MESELIYSPISKQMSCLAVGDDNLKTFMCLFSGYQTSTLMYKDSEYTERILDGLPQLYKDLSIEDELGLIWVPMTINLKDKAILFIDGTSKDEWKWCVAPYSKEEDSEEMKVNLSLSEYYGSDEFYKCYMIFNEKYNSNERD